MNLKRKGYTILIVVIGIALIPGCIYTQSENRTIQAKYPLEKIETERNVIRVYLAKNAGLSDIINMGIFKGVTPQMTDNEVTNLLGTPSDETTRYDSRFLVYNTDVGRLESGASTGILANGEYYYSSIIMFFKDDFEKSLLFKGEILNYIPDDDIQIGVFLKEKCDFVITLSKKKEDWIQWSSNE